MDDARDLPRPAPEELTRYLNELGRGNDDGSAALMPFVYEELRAIAAAHLRGADPQRTLQPTMLVHSAFIKLFRGAPIEWNDRRHFFVVAAKAMRQLVIDDARRRKRLKRGEGREGLTLDECFAQAAGIDFDLLDLDRALGELAELEQRQCRVVELRFFAGLDVAETARVLGVSPTTVERDWRFARAWLGRRLDPPAG